MRHTIWRQSGIPLRCLGAEIECMGKIANRRYKSSGVSSANSGEGAKKSQDDGSGDGAVDYLSKYNQISGTTRWESKNTDIEEDHQSKKKKKKEYHQIDQAFKLDATQKEANVKTHHGKHIKKPVRQAKLQKDPADYLSKYSQISNTTNWESKHTDIEENHASIQRKKKEHKQIDHTFGLEDASRYGSNTIKSLKSKVSGHSSSKKHNTIHNGGKKDAIKEDEVPKQTFPVKSRETSSPNKLASSKQKLPKHASPSFKPTSNLSTIREFSTSATPWNQEDPTLYLKKLRMMNNFMNEYDIPLKRMLPTYKKKLNSDTKKYLAKDGRNVVKTYGNNHDTKHNENIKSRKSIQKRSQHKANQLEPEFNDKYGRPHHSRSNFFTNHGRTETSKLIPRPELPKIGEVSDNVNHLYAGFEGRDDYNREFENRFIEDFTYLKIQDRDLGSLSPETIKTSPLLLKEESILSIIEKHELVSNNLEKGDIVRFIEPLYYLGRKGIIICDTDHEDFKRITRDFVEIQDGRFKDYYVVLVIRTGFYDFLDPVEGFDIKGFYTKKHGNTSTSKMLRRRRQMETELYHPSDPAFKMPRGRHVHPYFETTDPFNKPPWDEISANSQTYFGAYLDVIPKTGVMDTGQNSDLELLDNPRLLDSLIDSIESPIVENDVIVPELKKAIFEPKHAFLFSGEGQAFEVRDY